MPGSDTSPNAEPISLTAPVQFAPGVGPRRAVLMERLGIRNVADLLKHLPTRWERHAGHVPIGELAVDSLATVVGEVTTCRFIGGRGHWRYGPDRGKSRFVATVEDATHRLDVVWFHGGYLRDQLHPGMRVELSGKVVLYDDHRQMVNPRWRIIEPDEQITQTDDHLRPIYPTTDELSSTHIEKAIGAVLEDALSQIEDHFDPAYRQERALPELRDAYRMLHAPRDEDEVKTARRRLAYDELALLQLGLAARRHHATQVLRAPALRHSQAIDEHIRLRFPFELTEAQDRVVRQIAADLSTSCPMNRLLQGDVGSGKTVVALYAMLMAAASGKQAALMAPTELLAEQHHLSIATMLDQSSVRIALLTGSLTPAERQRTHQAVEAGEIDLVVGTQALLTGSVQFADLAVVVVDEQHRFGVLQRAEIRSKSAAENTSPHYLVMTATPIPRTLGLTLFGDLDISTIDALPPGRRPIETRMVSPDQANAIYQFLASHVQDGKQAYVVVPAIDDNSLNLTTLTERVEQLQKNVLPDNRVEAVHGRLTREQREAIMTRFRDGHIDVLVATTVIEVGVDVPNAAVMVIEHAERFGLAQLHQLRGRVGRGSKPSTCLLITDPITEDAAARLQAITQTTDGFKIAEADLQIRGMGELMGMKQSGMPPLRIARIPEDFELLQMARRDARAIIEADPTLTDPARRLLRGRLLKQYGGMISLGDVA